MDKALEKPFDEKEAQSILEAWCKEGGKSLLGINDMIRWDYTGKPFYSLTAVILPKGGWLFPDKMRFQIYGDGTLTVFKDEKIK